MEASHTGKLKKIIPQISEVPGICSLDTEAVLEAHKQPAVTSIRINPLKPTPAFSDHKKVP